ncbi:CDP-alcohol phosphatidyltransferase family protein [Columbia Basin potato purple top phytoplasma]|uniref:CDP-alcohol phosphatidyltransferase family protein n=1 Tax=Columbia Basin potato purple top phytoplasma TaxID=307134 RepID=A0ABT5LBG8_9MOLU|nr:CDP-alcohol phosphatidyltransferase family protein [Columbia Basin potato purple top phytoplasma]MDC9031998.1 CDP-alcohol phosphatidyltransferase family protein [Columbia Basin potato purple top phytoplasma]
MKKLIKISANLITLFRIFLVFFMLPFLFLKHKNLNSNDVDHRINFSIIFILASITDFLDGYIAKKFKTQTIFGKFFDPIADKLLVIVSFFYIYTLCNKGSNYKLFNDNNNNKTIGNLILIALLTNIIRDFVVMGLRLIAVEQKKIITASILGKLKTIFTFCSILLILFSKQIGKIIIQEDQIINLIKCCLIINIILIIYSGSNYIIKNFKFIQKSF